MYVFLNDLRYVLRRLLNNGGATATCAFVIGLVIAAATTVFVFIDSILLKPLPYFEPERLVRLWEYSSDLSGSNVEVSVGSFAEWREQGIVFDGFGALYRRGTSASLSEDDKDHAVIMGNMTTGLLPTLGVRPLLGRGFAKNDTGRVALIGYGLWQRQFGGDESVLGQSMTIDDRAWTVIGVLPLDHYLLSGVDVWTPVSFDLPMGRRQRSQRHLEVVARLAQGANTEQALTDLTRIMDRLQQEYPTVHGGWDAAVEPLHMSLVSGVRPALLVLAAAVTLLLFLGCFNVATVLLAQATARQQEIAVRTALGAQRRALGRLLFLECLGIALLGGTVGLFLTYWAVHIFVGMAPNLEAAGQVGVARNSIVAALGLSLLSACLAGFIPVLKIGRLQLSKHLRGSRGSDRGSLLLNRVLVGAQIALALAVMASTGLLVRSFFSLLNSHPGFEVEGLQTVQLRLPFSGHAAALAEPLEAIINECRTIPGVLSVGAISTLPLGDDRLAVDMSVRGRPIDERWSVYYSSVSWNYFETTRIPLLEGRLLTPDDHADAAPIALVNATLARRLWPVSTAVGQFVKIEWENVERRVVGVVGDVRSVSLAEKAPAEVYLPYSQFPFRFTALIFKTGDKVPPALMSTVRERVREIYPSAKLLNFAAYEDILKSTLPRPRLVVLMMTSFSVLAAALAVVGVYGVVSLATHRRRRELGIRLALGGTPDSLLRLLISDNLRTIVGGLIGGVALMLILASRLEGLLFEVDPFDVPTIGFIAAVVSAVEILAVYAAARKMIALDIVTVLRAE